MFRLGIKYQEDRVCIEEKERSQYPIATMARELAQAVMAQWVRANAELCPPIVSVEDTIAQRMKKKWNTMSDIAWRREKKPKKAKIF